MEMIFSSATNAVTPNDSSCMNGCGPYCACLDLCYAKGLCPFSISICPIDISICPVNCLCIKNA